MSENTTPKKQHLPDDLAILICRISSEWAMLEMKMCFLLAELLDVEPKVASSVLFPPVSNRVRRDIIENAAATTLSDGELKKRIKRILDRIKNAGKKRNDILHSFWIYLEEDDVTVQFLLSTEHVMVGREVTKDQLRRVEAQVMAVSGDLVHLTVDISVSKRPGPSPDKSPQ